MRTWRNGIRARLRCVSRKGWRFESSRPHKMTVDKLDTLVFVGQKAFIHKGDKVLVLRDPDYAVGSDVGLDFPGGKYRWGNDIHDELQREVTEETGLKITIGKPFTVWKSQSRNQDLQLSKMYLVGFFAEYVSGEVILSDEHDKFEWVDKKSYQKWQEDTDYFRALEEYFKIKGT